MSETLKQPRLDEGSQKTPEALDPKDTGKITKAEVVGGSAIVIASRISHMGEALHTDVVRIPEVGAAVTLHAHGKNYPAKVERVVSSDNGVQIIIQAPADYPDPNLPAGTVKRYAFTPQEYAEVFGQKPASSEAAPQTKAAETTAKDTLNEREAAYEVVKDTVIQNIEELVAQFPDREVPQTMIDGQLLIMRHELDTAGLSDKQAELTSIIQQYFVDHKDYVSSLPNTKTTVAPTNIETKNQIKPIAEEELATLQKLNANEFAAKVAEQLIAQFPNQPIPEGTIALQQLVGARYETSWGGVNRRTNKKNEVADKIGQALRQHNEDVLPKVEQRLAQQLDTLISQAGTQRLTAEALAPFRQELAALTINNATESYIRLRQKLEARITSYNNKTRDTEIAATESKYKGVLNDLIAKHADTAIPEAEVNSLQKQIDTELSNSYSAEFIASLKQSLVDQIADHKKRTAEKASLVQAEEGRLKQSADARKNFKDSIEAALATNPNIEHDINDITKKLDVAFQSTTLDSTAIQTTFDQALTELGRVEGMNPLLLESVKKQWEGMRKTAEDLNPVQTLVANYLGKLDTPVTESAAGTVMTLLNTVSGLNNAQRKVILEGITKKFISHNQAIESRTKNPQRVPPPLPSKAASIEIKDSEIEDIPDEAISDPDFNNKVDDLDEAASKLLQSMSDNSTNDLIDTDVLTDLLVEELRKQNLKTDSKEAIAWLSAQQETAYQINRGIESLNQENEHNRLVTERANQERERIPKVIESCHKDIDTLLISPDCSTLEEIAAIQTQINTLPDDQERADLQKRLTEVDAHDQAVLQADTLIEKALASAAESSPMELQLAIQTLLPSTAGDEYWKIAEVLINEHNSQLLSNPPTEGPIEDIAKIDALVSECNDKVSELLMSGELVSITDFADLQTKIDSIPDAEVKAGLQKNIVELQEHNQALKQADTLMETALATNTAIDNSQMEVALGKLIPTAIEQYWRAAEEIINEHNAAVVAPLTTPPDQTQPDPVATVVDTTVVTPSQTSDPISPQAPDQGLTATIPTIVGMPAVAVAQTPDATIAQAPDTVINTHPATPDQPLPAAVTVVSGTPIVAPASTPDPAPQADVLGVAPVATTVTAPVDVLNKVDATPLSAEQIAKRDEMFGLIEKNLVLTEAEKGQMMVKVMELLRTATRNTNVIAELQKLMTSQDRHQEIQRQLKEKSPIFAMIVQDAVQSSLNTNDLGYKTNEAEYQKLLSDLPTDAARKAMQAIYDEAISSKKLRGDLKAIQAKVEEVLTNQANFSDARNESLLPLFKRMNVIVKTGLSRESQVLGSQTVAPDLSQWEAPKTDEKTESFREKAKRKFLAIFDRIRGKKAEAGEESTDTTNDLDEAYVRSPAEMVDFLIEGNLDLTTAEKAALKANALESLEKGTDISKTVEKLKATLTERSRVNREISALVLDAPQLSREMYSALDAAFDEDISPAKRTEALATWQSFVDQLATDRAKAVVKAVYQEALKNKDLRGDVGALEEKIADKLASTDVDARDKALTDLINVLGSEINRAISNRKSSEAVVDQVPDVVKPAVVAAAAEVLASAVKPTVETPDDKLNQALVSKIISVNLGGEAKKRDVLPQEFFGSDIDQLITIMAVEKNPALNDELKAIRQILVDSKPGVMISTEATDRLETALKAKYPEVLDTIMKYVNMHIQEHDVRTAMQAEITAKNTELTAKIDTLSSDDISREIKALRQKFASRINPFGVDQALAPLNDSLRERMHTDAAVKEIDRLWQNPSKPGLGLDLDKVATILSNNQLDNTIQLSLIELSKQIAPIINAATKVGREISRTEHSNIIFTIIPSINNIPQALRTPLVKKINKMVADFNDQARKSPHQQAA